LVGDIYLRDSVLLWVAVDPKRDNYGLCLWSIVEDRPIAGGSFLLDKGMGECDIRILGQDPQGRILVTVSASSQLYLYVINTTTAEVWTNQLVSAIEHSTIMTDNEYCQGDEELFIPLLPAMEDNGALHLLAMTARGLLLVKYSYDAPVSSESVHCGKYSID
jgi:hypothetical protein